MDVIPVLDLMGGAVVRGQGGDRSRYRPIETKLAQGSAPLGVVAGLLALHPFRRLYVADLDAIERQGDAAAVLRRIADAHPHLELWVDNGCSDADAARAFLSSFPQASLVLGSESQADAALVRSLAAHPRTVLSLDFRGDSFVGPADLLDDPEGWPARIVVMTLARVGSGAGPDLGRLADIRRMAGARAVYAAGGLRDATDLAAARNAGAAGILVASALHDGRLAAAELEACGA